MPHSNSVRLFFLGLVVLFASACKGTIDRRVDPDAPDGVGGAVLQSPDIRAIAQQMARDIGSSGLLTSTANNQRVTFHVVAIENHSSDNIDKEMIPQAIVTELLQALQGRIAVLDRSAGGLEAVRQERAAKRSGAVSANEGRRADVLGSDYVLRGVIRDRTQQSGTHKSVYYQVVFSLTDLETGEVKWQKLYDTKFESEKSVISR